MALRKQALLLARDPLSETVHLRKAGFARLGLIGVGKGALGRLTRRAPVTHAPLDAK